jgi:hypothetical protein
MALVRPAASIPFRIVFSTTPSPFLVRFCKNRMHTTKVLNNPGSNYDKIKKKTLFKCTKSDARYPRWTCSIRAYVCCIYTLFFFKLLGAGTLTSQIKGSITWSSFRDERKNKKIQYRKFGFREWTSKSWLYPEHKLFYFMISVQVIFLIKLRSVEKMPVQNAL